MSTVFMSSVTKSRACGLGAMHRAARFGLGLVLTVSLGMLAPLAYSQGSRKDDIVFGPSGHPVAGATLRVCQAAATGTPCAPLATIYTDATLTVSAANPFQSDGLGNYHFYAPAGRYVVQVSGPGITGTLNYPDVILPPDVSSSGSGNNISAYGLTLGGNLGVAGNATVGGTLTAGNFAPSALSVAGSETVAGPRPRVDVTAYGAKGDGTTDDTAAIQAAINIACQNASGGGANGGGAVTFPPPVGSAYKITQPQSPNNNPIFMVPVGCQGAGNGLSIVGLSGNWNQVGNGGGRPPSINIFVSCGPSPGLGPVFLFNNAIDVFMQNLSITGCNQAVQVNSTTASAQWHFQNVNLGIQVLSGQGICSSNPACTTDNVPLAIYNNIEGWYEGGALQNGGPYDLGPSATGPNILVASINSAGGNNSAIMTFQNLFLGGGGNGGGVVADTRCNNGCNGVNDLHFIDIETEASGSTPFLTVQAENGTPGGAGGYYLEHVGQADNNPGTPCIFLSGATWYHDITIIDSSCSSNSGPAIVVQSGTLLGCFLAGNLVSGHSAVNTSGQAVSGCTWETLSGLDYTSPINSLSSNYLGTNATVANGWFGNSFSCPVGMTRSGDTNRSLCVDPWFGVGFGPGGTSGSGYDTRFYRSGNQSVALMLAQADGPTSPTATLAAGGSLATGTYTIGSITNIGASTEEVYCPSICYVAPGQSVPITGNSNSNFNTTVTVSAVKGPQVWDFTTGTPGSGTGGAFPSSYWYVIESTMGTSNCSSNNLTGPSKEVNAAPVSGTQTINLSWTPGTGGVAGYCVWRGNVPGAENAYSYVSGQSTTSLSDTGSVNFASGSLSTANQTFPANPQFTWNTAGLGINTTTPQYSLDVAGAAAVNSLNGVQKAERFTGVDAAAKINACLQAASTTSGVCDARGLTGSLTASTHIAIPAATILMWGNAELTISDTNTNDAVELDGDGASLYGDQGAGPGLVSRPDSGGYIACGTAGCTTLKNPNAASGNIEWNNIERMSLIATGAGSKVIDLTSIGHAHVEDNRLILGSGGGSYGIFGDTSTGNHDSTNNLIKHNEIDNQTQNDTCLYERGIFNINQLEINVCYLASQSTGQEGYVFAKDTSGNYPNNVQLYGNDCEQGGASVSYGVYCYDVQGAQDVTFGPNNRCEHVYACVRFPTDGSAVGIHVIDPYLSLSNSIQLAPNEPGAAMDAIDNNGHNWLPSMHFGFNDLAGPNLLGNAGFEGWQNSTTLYYWGGANGTNINQSGSGIYAQHAVGTSPADTTTQSSYNVAIGDNATAGLGINSGCIQVDATQEYTLAFRIAASSTSINFRPGFRFYSDPNCTEANRITSIATNARVLSPANYAGTSALVGTGPNWQSANASLTYNNGITCNCNVTGFDWQVASGNTWTPTRNYAITFRVPNAFSGSSTVAQSMRVFILENTAANPNVIYVDDAVLSQGPVSQNVPKPAPLADSGSPTVYGNLTVSGNFVDPNFAAHGVLLGEGSSAVAAAAPTGNSQCLMSASSNGTATDPSFQTCPGAGGSVTSLSGDGALVTNSGSTGAVTLTLGSAAAHKWWGNPAGASGAPGYNSIGTADLPSTTVEAITSDVNVTGSISSQNLTLGWNGTLAAGRLNANVVQSVTNDTNVTGSIASQNLTLGWAGNLSVARGGSGAGTFTAHGVLLGEGTNAFGSATPTGNSQCLISASSSGTTTDPSFQSCPSVSGSTTTNDCVAFVGTNIQDAGSPCPALLTRYSMGIVQASTGVTSANAIDVSVIYLPNVTFSKIAVNVGTTDSSTSDFYSWAITDLSGNVKCSVAAVNLTSGGTSDQSCTQGSVTLANGAYIFAFTGNSTTGKISYSGTVPLPLSSAISSSASSSGVMSFPINIPVSGATFSSYGRPAIILH